MPTLVRRGFNPVRIALLLFGLVMVIIYAFGYNRGLPPVEATAADRKMLMLASVMGVALFAVDGVRNRRRLDRLLKRLTIFGAINAAIGVIQFATGFDIAARIVIPGLHPNSDFTAFKERGAGAFIRVTGTSTHPIEFGVMMAILLPLALHYRDARPGGLPVPALADGRPARLLDAAVGVALGHPGAVRRRDRGVQRLGAAHQAAGR